MTTTFNHDITQYAAHNDFGAIGIEATVVADRAELVDNIIRGELGFTNIIAVQAFNAAEGWAIDCTDDVLADVEAERTRRQDERDFLPFNEWAENLIAKVRA